MDDYAKAVIAVVGIGTAISATVASSNVNTYAKTKQKNLQKCANEFVEPYELVAEIGDLIEFARDYYYHLGVCVSPGYVIHFVNLSDGTGVVKLEALSEVANREKCRVNNLETVANSYGLQRKSNKDICANAYKCLDDKRAYDVMNENCEHFATECAYGTAFSDQSHNIKDKPFVALTAKYGSSKSKSYVETKTE